MEPLESTVRSRLAAFRQSLGPLLGRALDEMQERLEFGRSGSYFLAPAAQPVLQLPGWVEASVGTWLSPRISDTLVESAAVAYLHVRLQDDLLDEGVGDPATVMMLSDVLFTRHQGLLARVVGEDAGFWELFEDLWRGYGEASLLEQALFESAAGYDEAGFVQVQQRSHPLMLPGAAVLAKQGRWGEVGELRGFVEALVAAHQRFHDLVDAQEDLRLGNPTYVVQRFGGLEGAEAFWKRLFLEGGFDEVVTEVMADLDVAVERAEAMGMGAAVAFVEERRGLVRKTQQAVFRRLFEQILET